MPGKKSSKRLAHEIPAIIEKILNPGWVYAIIKYSFILAKYTLALFSKTEKNFIFNKFTYHKAID